MKYLGSFALLAVVFSSSTGFSQVDGKKGRQRPGQGGFNLERMMKALDKNNDGKLSQAEAPDRMKDRFAQMDANSDGFVDTAELKKMIEMRARRGGQGDQPGKGGSAKGKKGNPNSSDSPRPDFAGRGRGFDLAALFKQGDKDGDGNLNPKEQAAIIEKFKEVMAKMRQMRGGEGRGKDAAKKGNDRYSRPDTDPVKPKRPGMED